MRKALFLTPWLALAAAGCGSSIDRTAVVDTTLPNSVAALDPGVMSDDTMVTDMNATEGMDTMTDNMTAVDALAGEGMIAPPSAYPSMLGEQPADTMAADALDQAADNLEAMADRIEE